MKNLTDFHKMVESVRIHACIWWCFYSRLHSEGKLLLRPFGNPYFPLKWEFIGTSCIGSNRVKQCPK